MNYKLLMYDFEVFKYDWLVVLIDYQTKEKNIIINNKDELQKYYETHKDYIWVGFNNRTYDSFILKGILLGLNPYKINNEIIVNDKKGYYVVKNHNDIQLYNYDVMFSQDKGLKTLEGFMGSMIKESDIPFDIDRKLTNEEIKEIIKYCTHDVEQTILVFEKTKKKFDAQIGLLETYNLSLNNINKTGTQLSAIILEAQKTPDRNDEFNISIPDTLILSDKYKCVLEWYMNPLNRNYKKSLTLNVANVPTKFAWGGVHGSIDNVVIEGNIYGFDVASLYPSLIIEYNYMSRNVKDPSKYKEIRTKRIEYKKAKNPIQESLKLVLNYWGQV